MPKGTGPGSNTMSGKPCCTAPAARPRG
jgi:hypothetical protein